MYCFGINLIFTSVIIFAGMVDQKLRLRNFDARNKRIEILWATSAKRGRSASRKRSFRSQSPSGKSNRQPRKNFMKCICTKLPMTTGILPNVNSLVWIGAQSARFRRERLRNNRMKSRKRVVTKVQWLWWKMYDSWVAYFRTQTAGIFIVFAEGHKSLGTISKRPELCRIGNREGL